MLEISGLFFFFQAEDGIRDLYVTGVQTCALPISQFGRRVTAAGNIVVVQSELGSAPAIGRALDELGHERIVGTLAGDDTCLVIAPSERDARSLARELGDAVA